MEELNPQNFPAFVLPPASALLLGRWFFLRRAQSYPSELETGSIS